MPTHSVYISDEDSELIAKKYGRACDRKLIQEIVLKDIGKSQNAKTRKDK